MVALIGGAPPMRVESARVSKTSASKELEYRLRNEPDKYFQIKAKAKGNGKKGSLIKALVTRYDELQFRYQVTFEGPFAETKANFTAEMYLLTALNVISAQLESHRHEDTVISIHHASGLMDTQPGAKLNWEKP